MQGNNKKIKKGNIGLFLIGILLVVGIWMFINSYANKADELEAVDFWQYVKI